MTTTQTISRERLENFINLPLGNGLTRSEQLDLARFALSAMDSEPVATLDVQSGRPDGRKFALVYSPAAHKLPDDVYFLHTAPPATVAVPDGYCLIPQKLTAANGAKGALSGEFHIPRTVTCCECGGDGCEDCDDQGEWEEEIPIGWDIIKLIYAAAVETCALTVSPAAPEQEV